MSYNRRTYRALFLLGAWLTAGGWAASGAVRMLPMATIKLVDGRKITAQDLAGKVVVVDFWGTWCKPCLAEIPEYNSFYREYRDKGVVFLALAADSGTPAKVRDASQRLKIEYPVAAPDWDQLDGFGELQVFPTTMIYDRQGRLRKEFLGTPPGKHKELREMVDRLLQAE
jgi:thiol-disulfide isomerase/thioredoxin